MSEIVLAGFWQNPAVVGLILAIPATVLGYLGYRRSRGLDRVAEQAGIATTHATSIGQVVDGLNSVIAAVKSDNEDLRKRVEQLEARLEAVETGNTDLRAKNRELERENNILHAENEAFKLEIEQLKARIDELEKANGP